MKPWMWVFFTCGFWIKYASSQIPHSKTLKDNKARNLVVLFDVISNDRFQCFNICCSLEWASAVRLLTCSLSLWKRRSTHSQVLFDTLQEVSRHLVLHAEHCTPSWAFSQYLCANGSRCGCPVSRYWVCQNMWPKYRRRLRTRLQGSPPLGERQIVTTTPQP